AFCAIAALYTKSLHSSKGQACVSQLGQHVDVSVRDIATSFMGPALLDYAMNHREAFRQGNRDDAMAPHGVYRCRGDDAWVSVAIGSEKEWLGLVRALGNPAWARNDTFGDAYQRWLNQDELDLQLEAWTAQLSLEEVTQRLQREGVAAFPSLSADQLMSDPHLL